MVVFRKRIILKYKKELFPSEFSEQKENIHHGNG
jgi:hypothetical protein